VLNAEPSAYSGLCIIRRRGLAAWIKECGSEPQVDAVRTNHQAAPATTRDLSPAANKLTRLLAGIIVALAMEPAHAHG
jgi:cobalamin biosynthesis protein CbiG